MQQNNNNNINNKHHTKLNFAAQEILIEWISTLLKQNVTRH